MDKIDLSLGDATNKVGESWSFIGVKVGDLNFDAKINRTTTSPLVSSNNVISTRKNIKTKDIQVESHECFEKGTNIEIKLDAENEKDIIAYQLGIKYDPSVLRVKNLKKGELHEIDRVGFGKNINNEIGEIKVSWVEDDLQPRSIKQRKCIFTLDATLSEKVCDLSSFISLQDKVLENWLYEIDEKPVKPSLSIIVDKKKGQVEDNLNLIVSPNPTRSNLNFSFFLDKKADVIITLEDENGNRLKVSRNLSSGNQVISMDNLGNLSNGVLIYFFELKKTNNKDLRSGFIIKN